MRTHDLLTTLASARRFTQASARTPPVALPLATRHLRAAGFTRRDIEQLLALRALVRITAGWYAEPSVDHRVSAARAAGAVLTCQTALVLLGGWETDDRRTHVRFRESRRVTEAPKLLAPMVRHGSIKRSLPGAASTELDAPLDALRCAARCLPCETLIIVSDAALHRGIVPQHAFDEFVASLSNAAQNRFRHVSSLAAAGSESRVRLLFQRHGIDVVPQFSFAPGKYCDLLVDGWLVIECDSVAFHTGRDAVTNDRARTLELQSDRYFVVRLMPDDVWLRWETTSAMLLDLVQRGRSRLRPRGSRSQHLERRAIRERRGTTTD